MVKVFSNNQEFNITQSLYESIVKNNPELLQEKKEDSVGIKDFIAQMLKINGFNIDNVSKEERTEILKILSKKIEKGGNNSTEIKNVIKKFIDDYNKENDFNDEEKPSDNNYLQDAKSDEVAKDIAEKIPNVSSHESNDNQEQNNSASNLENNEENKSDDINNNEVKGYPITYVSDDEYKNRIKRMEKILSHEKYFMENIKEIINNIAENKLVIDNETKRKVLEKVKVKQDAQSVAKELKSNFNSLNIKQIEKSGIIRYLSEKDFNKCIGIIEQGISKFGEIKNALESFMFNESDRPRALYIFLDRLKRRVETMLILNSFQVKFQTRGGDRKYYLDDGIRQEFVNAVKRYNGSNGDTNNLIDGVEIWRFFKSTSFDNIWKNVLTIDCRTSDAYAEVQKQASILLSSFEGGTINITQRGFPTGLKTKSSIYVVSEKNNNENIDIIKNISLEFSKDPTMSSNKIAEDLMKLKRVYIILVTEGLYNKGELMKKSFKTASNILKNPESVLGKSISNKI